MYVLTGGAGFIGSAFLSRLNSENISDIIVVDNLVSADKEKNLEGKKYLKYYDKAEFLNLVKSRQLPKEITTIIHLGACSSTTETDKQYMMSNNFEYTKTLAEYSLERDIRFLYASSAATYGDGSLGFSDNDSLTPTLQPLNIYAESKLLFDKWAIETGAVEKMVGIRYFNVFGPNEYHKGDMRSVVHKAFHQVKDTGEIKLFKSYHPDYQDGEQLRDFVYVKGCSEVLWQILNNKNIAGIFNLGTGQAKSWNDLAKGVFSALEEEANIKYIDMPETLRAKYQYRTEADLAKLRAAGIATKFTSLENAIGDYITRYLAADLPYM